MSKDRIVKLATTIFETTIGSMAVLSATLLLFITIAVTTGVIARYFFRNPLMWVVEISSYCLLFITFLGAAWVLKREKHVSMDMVLRWLSPHGSALLNLVTSVLGVVITLTVTIYTAESVWNYYEVGYRTTTLLYVPQWIILLVIPLGVFALCIQFIRRSCRYWREWMQCRARR